VVGERLESHSIAGGEQHGGFDFHSSGNRDLLNAFTKPAASWTAAASEARRRF
jgi:hypothetical protein